MKTKNEHTTSHNKRIKIGKGFFPMGYGGRFQVKSANIWEINGKAYAYYPSYAKTAFIPLEGDLEGYIPVNKLGDYFLQVNPNTHEPIKK